MMKQKSKTKQTKMLIKSVYWLKSVKRHGSMKLSIRTLNAITNLLRCNKKEREKNKKGGKGLGSGG